MAYPAKLSLHEKRTRMGEREKDGVGHDRPSRITRRANLGDVVFVEPPRKRAKKTGNGEGNNVNNGCKGKAVWNVRNLVE